MKRALVLSFGLVGILAASAGAPHWEWSGWGGGGWFWCAAADPADGDVFYMGGDVDGLWKTTDAGRTWQFRNAGLPNYAVYSLAVAPSDARTVYALTGGGVAVSTDGAETWKACPQTARASLNILAGRGGSIHALAVDPTDPKTVYAGGASGRVVKSTDGGTSWTVLDCPTQGAAVNTVAVSGNDRNLVFVCRGGLGLFRSVDAGATWRKVDGAPAGARTVCWAGPRAPHTWYGAFGADGVQVSTDDGLTWLSLNAPACSWPAHDVVSRRDDTQTVHALFVQSFDCRVATTRNGGAEWTVETRFAADHAANPTLPEKWGADYFSGLENLAISPVTPDHILAPGNWNPCFSRDGGRTWAESCRGADITCFQDIRFLDGSVYGAAMDEGTCRSADGGAQWSALFPRRWTEGLSGHHWRVLPQKLADGRTRVISTVSPWAGSVTYPVKVIVSEDGGKSFTVATGLPAYRTHANTMWGEGHGRALAADPTDPDVVYLGIDGDPENGNAGGGIFRSTDGGHTWSQLPNQPASRRMFFGLAVDPTNPQRVVWGACGDNSGVYVSENAGASWTKAAGLGDWIYNVEISPTGVIYASGNQLYRSTDHGRSFQTVSSFSCGGTVMGIAIDPNDEKRLWTSVAAWDDSAVGGVFETTDGCRTWTEITGDIPNRKPMVVRYDPDAGCLWAAGPAAFKLQVDAQKPVPSDIEITVAAGLGTVAHEGVLDVSTNLTITVGAGTRYVVGRVTGSATLTKRGPGELVFTGGGSDRSAGETIVAEGTVSFGEHQSYQLGGRVVIGGEGKPASLVLTSTRAWATDIFDWRKGGGAFVVKDQGTLDFSANGHAVELRPLAQVRVEEGGAFKPGAWRFSAADLLTVTVGASPSGALQSGTVAAPVQTFAADGTSVFRVPLAKTRNDVAYTVQATDDLTRPFLPCGVAVQRTSDGNLAFDIPTGGRSALFVRIRAQ